MTGPGNDRVCLYTTMKYSKIAPLQVAILVITVTIYIALLILTFNKHPTSTKPMGIEGPRQEPLEMQKKLKWIADESRYRLPDQPPNLQRANVRRDKTRDADREWSVSGDSAGYDQSSTALFSYPFADQAQNIRRIYPKNKRTSRINFKSVTSLSKEQHNPLNYDFEAVKSIQRVESSPERKPNGQSPNARTSGDAVCVPHVNVTFIKTHKTASSTLQNIFYRFGDERNLTFALPARDVYVGAVREFRASSILPAPPGTYFNMMANHVRFFYNDIKDLMPSNSKFVTIIRQSVNQFRSMYSYYILDSQFKATVEQYSLNPEYYYDKFGMGYKRHNGRDPMLFDLGMEKSASGDLQRVRQYVEFLDSKFDLVLITEFFYESLILLKELLCWDMRALVHMNNKILVSLAPELTTRSAEDQRASDDVAKRLDRWNTGDVMMYDYFNKTLWRKIDAYGRSRMGKEVAELKDLCRSFERECMNGTKVRDISRGSLQQTGLAEYVVKSTQTHNMTCRRLSWVPRTYLSHLRTKHIAQFRKKDS